MRKEAENINQLTPKELLLTNVYVERQETIHINDIVDEYDLIDSLHAENLANSMMGERGQISPILVRARLDGDKIAYDLIDGFHRHAGKKIIQAKTGESQPMHTIVLYGCSDEELFDLRILAVNSVKKVKFARMAIWMTRSLEETTWQNKGLKKRIDLKEITLSQIFTLAQNNSSGKKLGLSESEANELKEWARNKAQLWRKSLPSLIQDMKTVELSAPDLVQRVRQGGGGGRGIFTAARLKAIVDNLPGEWELQRKFADMAVDKNILASDLDLLTWCYLFAKEAGDKETIEKIFKRPELLLNPQKPEIVISEPPKHKEVTSSFPVPWGKSKSTTNEPKNTRIPHLHPVPKKRHMPRRVKRYNEHGYKNRDEEVILQKHGIPSLFNAFKEVIIQEKGHELVVLNLPSAELKLDIKNHKLNLQDKEVQLSPSECDLMFAFFIFEGISLSTELLGTLSSNSKFRQTNVHESVASLRKKIFELCPKAAKELSFEKNKFSWLAE